MDLIILKYDVLARRSPLIIPQNGLTQLTPDWYKALVRAKGMIRGTRFDKEHELYDSDSPPKQRKTGLECPECGKKYKTVPALRGHNTRVHATRSMLFID